MADISKIHVNGNDYDIKDAEARRLISDLGNVMNFKGSKATEAEIKAITSANVGDVWLNSADGSEWVCTEKITAAKASAWEKLGFTLDISTKADKVTSATSGDLASLDANGNLSDSGVKVSTSLTSSNNLIPTSKAVMDALSSFGAGDMMKADYDPASTVKDSGGISSYVENRVKGRYPTSITKSTGTVYGFSNNTDAKGTLPTFSANVASETLSFSFTQGTLPTISSQKTFVTDITNVYET